MLDRLRATERRYEEIESLMAQPEVAADFERVTELARERASLEEVVSIYREFSRVEQAVQEAQEVLQEGDPDLSALAREELPQLQERRVGLEQRLRMALLPRDPNDDKDVIMEIRAGTGGEEAALFAAELYRMYVRYAQNRGWKPELIDANETGIGGLKEVVFEVHGKGAYSHLRQESGVHRVQRVPATEASGRIHTSTATVAVLPEADEVDIQLKPEELRIDIFHSGGAGGQNVNKVATAVRITHLPTGIVAVCQDERSQLRNKTKALAVIRSRLLQQKMQRQQEETASTRRAQVGTGERSEKVRTYNFPQDRVTDHRLGVSVYGIPRILAGELDQFIDALIADEQARKMEEAMV
ncbi:MAG: peptide chain release factor 1 [Chloroflexi bacterium]|nr:peptide chain release factor 1 [Chloroflexota bacterium]